MFNKYPECTPVPVIIPKTLKASVLASSGVSSEAGVECSYTATVGESFTQGSSSGRSSESQKFSVDYVIPPKSKMVLANVVGKRMTVSIPYTMVFNDGSTLEDFLTHKECVDLRVQIS